MLFLKAVQTFIPTRIVHGGVTVRLQRYCFHQDAQLDSQRRRHASGDGPGAFWRTGDLAAAMEHMVQHPQGASQERKRLICQVEGCNRDLGDLRGYHKRYRICLEHLKAQAVIVKGKQCRFCQQCGRFHELSEFQGARRSCRHRLEQHNRRRRIETVQDRQSEEMENTEESTPLSARLASLPDRSVGMFADYHRDPDLLACGPNHFLQWRPECSDEPAQQVTAPGPPQQAKGSSFSPDKMRKSTVRRFSQDPSFLQLS